MIAPFSSARILFGFLICCFKVHITQEKETEREREGGPRLLVKYKNEWRALHFANAYAHLFMFCVWCDGVRLSTEFMMGSTFYCQSSAPLSAQAQTLWDVVVVQYIILRRLLCAYNICVLRVYIWIQGVVYPKDDEAVYKHRVYPPHRRRCRCHCHLYVHYAQRDGAWMLQRGPPLHPNSEPEPICRFTPPPLYFVQKELNELTQCKPFEWTGFEIIIAAFSVWHMLFICFSQNGTKRHTERRAHSVKQSMCNFVCLKHVYTKTTMLWGPAKPPAASYSMTNEV